jgi:hypothetical protein
VCTRLESIFHHLGVALGGRPVASLARRVLLSVTRDTLLRVVRRRAMPTQPVSASSGSTIFLEAPSALRHATVRP